MKEETAEERADRKIAERRQRESRKYSTPGAKRYCSPAPRPVGELFDASGPHGLRAEWPPATSGCRSRTPVEKNNR